MNNIQLYKDYKKEFQKKPKDFYLGKYWNFFVEESWVKDILITDKNYWHFEIDPDVFLNNLANIQSKIHKFYFYQTEDLEAFINNTLLLDSFQGDYWFWYSFFFAENIPNNLIEKLIWIMRRKKVSSIFNKYIRIENVVSAVEEGITNIKGLGMILVLDITTLSLLEDKLFLNKVRKVVKEIEMVLSKIEVYYDILSFWYKNEILWNQENIMLVENFFFNKLKDENDHFISLKETLDTMFPWKIYHFKIFELLSKKIDKSYDNNLWFSREEYIKNLIIHYLAYIESHIQNNTININPLMEESFINFVGYFLINNYDCIIGIPSKVQQLITYNPKTPLEYKNLFLIRENFFNPFCISKGYHFYDGFIYIISLNNIDNKSGAIGHIELLTHEKELYMTDVVVESIEDNFKLEADKNNPYITCLFRVPWGNKNYTENMNILVWFLLKKISKK